MNLKESKQSNCVVAIYMNTMPTEKTLGDCLYSITEQTKPVDVLFITHGLKSEQMAALITLAQKPFFTLFERNDKGETVEKRIEATKKNNITFVDSVDELNFSQIFNKVFNLANEAGYDFISIAEAEDTFSLRWFEISQRYADENPEVSIFLPLIKNSINGTFSGLLNEAAWAEGMSEEAGKVDINLLMRFNCVNPLGALYRVSAIKEYSEADKQVENVFYPMKESIKLSHYYEFFLRMIYNDIKVMSVPRIGYELSITRKEVYTDSTCKLPQDITSYPIERGGVSPDEGRFWFELAKKEYFFDADRLRTYSPTI